jgi:peptidoglycan DL-endopeptidase CwlO
VYLHTRRPIRSRLKPGHHQPSRTLSTAIVGAFVGVVVAVASGAQAHADPPPSPAQIEAAIDRLWNDVEPTIEAHNAIKAQLAANKAKVAQLTEQIRPLQAQVDAAMAKVSEIAVAYYKGGPASTFNALLTSGSPTTLADQLTMLNMIARSQAEEISDVADLKAKYDAQKKPLDDLVAQLTTQEADLAAKEKIINAEIKRLNDMRLAAYGAGGGVGELSPVPCPLTYPGGAAGVAVQYACRQIGKTYVWGAEGPNHFDCSGLTLAAWRQAGIRLPHNAAEQRQVVTPVSRANLRAGDLVFYYSDVHHVGMYIGGNWIVHASRPGEPVRLRQIDLAPIKSYGRPG